MVSANPTGPITVASARNGRTATRSRGCSSSPGTTVEREYYYNDAGAQMERFRASVDAVRRGEEPPEDGYHGRLHRRAGAGRGRSDAADARADRGDARALPRSTSTRWALQSELEQRLPELHAAARHVREGRRRLGALVRVRRRGGPRDHPLAEQGGAPTYRAADIVYLVDKLERGFDRAIYVLGADHHGTRKWYAAIARMLGYDPERVEVLLYQLVHLTRAASRRRCRSAAATSSSSTSFMDEIGVDAARWYLVNRGPDQAIEIDVDLAAEKTQKNPVYYVQYAHARIAGILRNAGERPK